MEKNSTILIIDDERLNLDFFDVMLSRLGFRVLMADNGIDGLDLIVNEFPDLIILDNIMPDLTGWDLTRKLKQDELYKDFQHIPIIMFSAMDSVRDKIEGFELGIEDYITKPFNFSEVLARIRAVLRHKELSTQVHNREKRIALYESLHNSVAYFTKHLKTPMGDLVKEADNLNCSNEEAVKEFLVKVSKAGEQVIAALQGLEEEVSDLEKKGDQLKNSELSLEDLEMRFRKHFQEIENGQ